MCEPRKVVRQDATVEILVAENAPQDDRRLGRSPAEMARPSKLRVNNAAAYEAGTARGSAALGSGAARACLAMAIRKTFSNLGEGFCGSGGRVALQMLRPTCIGVMTSPQGNPHHPRTSEKAVSAICFLSPQERQETWRELFQWVKKTADQTR